MQHVVKSLVLLLGTNWSFLSYEWSLGFDGNSASFLCFRAFPRCQKLSKCSFVYTPKSILQWQCVGELERLVMGKW